MLDIVDIVMGFLSSGGGSADKPLGEYVEKVLKMRTRNFSEKVNTVLSLYVAKSIVILCMLRHFGKTVIIIAKTKSIT